MFIERTRRKTSCDSNLHVLQPLRRIINQNCDMYLTLDKGNVCSKNYTKRSSNDKKVNSHEDIYACRTYSATETRSHRSWLFPKFTICKTIFTDDYSELIEILGGDAERKFKFRPPGVIHQAPWMMRAIYSLKISLSNGQFKITNKDKAALFDLRLFIMTSYVKPWLQCNYAVKAPYQDLCFLGQLRPTKKLIKASQKPLYKS